MKMTTFKLKKGTVIKWKAGLPLRLMQDVEVETSEGNYNWLFNQSMQSPCIRSKATALDSSEVNKESLESM
ncbi:MAG: hypothetical protein O7D98_03935 [Candidatus Dadabacteria bacterium]|nr:hypothetical protein [Candidatus Dadabacteria bacterium]